MVYELQRAGIWKRIAAWMFDAIVTGMLAVGLGVVLSALLGYDGYSRAVELAYEKYETQYAVVFEISEEAYLAMSDEDRQNYDAAYGALIADGEAMYAYNMMLNLTLVITTLAILLAVLIWEFGIPLRLGNGQTLGKKIFGLCLVRNDGVKLNTMQLFTRTVLGKYTIETMIPVCILLMLFWGTMDLTGTAILLGLGAVQGVLVCFTRNHTPIHDLLAGTVVVDFASQMIFRTTEDLIAFQKQVAADRAKRQPY